MMTNPIALFAMTHAATCIRRSRKNTRRAVMLLAHAIRRAAAVRWNCTPGDILWSECLRQAWEETRCGHNAPLLRTNDEGFILFNSRNFSYRGDRGTWARLDGHNLTINWAAHGILSDAFGVEFDNFLSRLNISLRPGQRVTVSL